MKKSMNPLLAITAAFLCVMLGIFIGKNMLPNYVLRTYSAENSDSVNSTDSSEQGKININTASVDDLMQLPGIGKTTAESIVAYRKEQGRFQSVDDLLNVKGIGYGTLYKIHDLITAGG